MQLDKSKQLSTQHAKSCLVSAATYDPQLGEGVGLFYKSQPTQCENVLQNHHIINKQKLRIG